MVEHGWVNTWYIDRPSSTDHLLLWKRLKYLLSLQDPISDNPGRFTYQCQSHWIFGG